jgi:DNA-binding FrmR family transcriptional regulator
VARAKAITSDEVTRAELLRRLARIAGQVNGVARMVEEDRYCVEVLQQIASVQEALRGVAKAITQRHLETCVTDGLRSRDEARADALRKELVEILFRYAK